MPKLLNFTGKPNAGTPELEPLQQAWTRGAMLPLPEALSFF